MRCEDAKPSPHPWRRLPSARVSTHRATLSTIASRCPEGHALPDWSSGHSVLDPSISHRLTAKFMSLYTWIQGRQNCSSTHCNQESPSQRSSRSLDIDHHPSQEASNPYRAFQVAAFVHDPAEKPCVAPDRPHASGKIFSVTWTDI